MKFLILLSAICLLSTATVFADKIPSRALRVKALETAGLAAFAEKMDELDQDLLYMRARKKSAEELKKIYPNLPAANLRLFVKEVK